MPRAPSTKAAHEASRAAPPVDADARARLDLVDDAALARDGYSATAREQDRFLTDVVARRYGRVERSTLPALGPLAGAGLLVSGLVLELARGNAPGAVMLGAASLVLVAQALARLKTQAARARTTSRGDPFACVDEGGVLVPVLDEGERVVVEGSALGAERVRVRRVAGVSTLAWGLLLAGLPLAVLPMTPLAIVVGALASAAGALVFGHGAQSLSVVKGGVRCVVTDRRTFVAFAPGVGVSVPHAALRHRPVVVDRGEGRATLALALRPLASVGPLAIHGLIGIDDVESARAVEGARAVVAHRRSER